MRDPHERFWDLVDKTGDCWEWAGGINKSGYAYFRLPTRSGRKIASHRYAYQIAYGTIPKGRHIHHKCHNPACVRPDHLVALTRAEHAAEHKADLTHCPAGHEYDEANTYNHPNGSKVCRECTKRYQLEYRQRLTSKR